MPVCDRREDPCHGLIIKLIDGHDLQMTCEATTDIVTASTRGTHSTGKQLQQTSNRLDELEISFLHAYMDFVSGE